MQIVIIGSFRKHMQAIDEVIRFFQSAGHTILSPLSTSERDNVDGFVLLASDISSDVKELQDAVLQKIAQCDFVYVVNPGGYVGASAILEIGYANAINKPVYALEKPNDVTIPHYVHAWMSPDALLAQLSSAHKPHLFFDADDTLWHDQLHFQHAEHAIEKLLDTACGQPTAFQKHFINVERKNIPQIGFGLHSYLFSLAEAFYNFAKADHRKCAERFEAIVAKLTLKVQSLPDLLPGVPETLAELRRRKYTLAVLTRGAVSEQRQKLERARLDREFQRVHVVEKKTMDTYRRICEEQNLSPSHCYMIGNSIGSDIRPALQAGWQAIHIPCDHVWQYDDQTLLPQSTAQHRTLTHFSELLGAFE